jgi:hypothetical protein
MVAFVVEAAGDDPQAVGIVFSLLLVVAALLAGFKAPGPIRSGCTAALVLAAPILWLFAVAGDGNFGTDELRGFMILTVLSYLALYLLGWTRGRGIFLGGTLVVFASWLAFEIAGNGGSSVVPFQDQVSSSFNSSVNVASSSSDTAAAVAMFLGIAYLLAGGALDRRKLAGAATPFIAVGAYETISGAISLGGQESTLLGGLLAVVSGALVGVVAARGVNRRGSTWFGALAVFGGMVAIIADIAPDSAAGVGGIATVFALLLGVLAWRLAPVLGESDDGHTPETVLASPDVV